MGVLDGFGPTYLPSPLVDDTIEVTITVTQVARRVITGGGGGGGGPALTAPKFVDGFRTSRSLEVTAREGAAVGDPVAATHPNDDDVTYSLSGANAALFTVDEETGQIRLGLSVTLELGQTYTVNLTATDSSGTGPSSSWSLRWQRASVVTLRPEPRRHNRQGRGPEGGCRLLRGAY